MNGFEILSAITHAVRASELRRLEAVENIRGLAPVAEMHSAACRRMLSKMLASEAVAASSRSV